MIYSSAAIVFLILFSGSSSAAELSNELTQANEFYQKGDCASAINAYQKIANDAASAEADKDLANFRSSYCYLDSKQIDAAIAGFQRVVGKYPQNDEARFRLAQALSQADRYKEARDEALKIKDSGLLPEAVLLAAQQDLELGEPVSAINLLSSVKVTGDATAIYAYWLGVAEYRDGDVPKAEYYFKYAISKSAPDLWVISESKGWLETIRKEKAWAHGSATFGYFYDGNVAEQSLLSVDSNNFPIQSAPLSSSYYTDNGYEVAANLTFRLVNEKRWNLYTSLSYSTPFYSVYSNYNNEVYTASVASSYKISTFWSTDLTAKYIDSRYAAVYYQDYLSLTAGVNSQLTKKLSARFEVPFTMYMNTTFSKLYGGNLSAHYLVPFGTIYAGESVYKVSGGPVATFTASGNTASLNSGTMFVNYNSNSTYLGTTVPLIRDFHITGQVSLTNVSYNKELVPSGTVQASIADRSDKTWAYSAELAGPLKANFWFASLSYTYTKDTSAGLQGLPSSGQISSYSYTRPYWLLTTTVTF